MSSSTLPDGFSIRDAQLDDAPAIADVVNESNVAEVGIPWTSAEEVRDDLRTPGRRRGDDIVVLDRDGHIVAVHGLYPDVDPFTSLTHIPFVRPSLWGRGLSAWLLRHGERLARDRLAEGSEPDSIALRVVRWANNEAAARLFESLGYRYARTFSWLRLELGDEPAEPVVPDGVELRTFDRGRDAAETYAALREAFADHWGHTFETFDEWVHGNLGRDGSGFDPGLWLLAVADGEVVGAITSVENDPSTQGAGYVSILGVRRPWRRRGIARALLLSSFAELRRRGLPAVELGVDAESPTGATRLYEGVGMRVVRRSEHWEKRLGRDDPGTRSTDGG
jgi:mycothiol synthase